MDLGRQLLNSYTGLRDEDAFREIVAMYIGLVFSVALRRMNGDSTLAADVVQEVFGDLPRQASRIPQDVALGAWLHRHTCFVAANRLRKELRRKVREKEASQMNTSSEADFWPELAPLVDQVINELPEGDRTAIVLRFYESKNFAAVGQLLNVSEDTAQKRVTRALEKVRLLLRKRGVIIPIAGLAGSLSANAIGFVPGNLLAMAVRAALNAKISTSLSPLQTLKLTFMAKTKFIAASLLVAGLGSGIILYQNQRGSAPPAGMANDN